MTEASEGTRYLRWTHRGEPLEALLRAEPESVPLLPPAPDDVIVRVEAVSICSSDIKVIRLGKEHPLLASSAEAGRETVLGHEVSLRVEAVGQRQRHRFHPGQRLGLQPAMRMEGRRRTIGFDVPGGFAQYLRLDAGALAANVFEVPECLTAAEIALLEPYGCVERAYRPNARRELLPEGSVLIVLAPGFDSFHVSRQLAWRHVTLVGEGEAPRGLPASDSRVPSLAELGGEHFDDIIALGEMGPEDLARLPALLKEGGLLLQARRTPAPPVTVDAARIHYDGLSFTGTSEPDFLDALRPERQRFDVRPGGTVLVHGAGGAMGRIHVHRLLQMENGPATVIATSRNPRRKADLEEDFAPLARSRGRRLVLAHASEVAATVEREAPQGLDDAVVVVPNPVAVAEAASWLGEGGLLAIFAGFAYGSPVPLDLAGVAVSGKRFTGSTGCSVEDMKDVLARVERGELDLTANLKAIAGLRQLPRALEAVDRGEVSGKIVIYPQAPDEPLQRIIPPWNTERERRLLDGRETAEEQTGG